MKKMKNPLIKRIPKELLSDWRKYLVISLFLILTIGAISGMYVANGSMMQAAEEGVTKYKLEYGHFILDKKADTELLSAIESGEKADIYQYYLDKAKKELDEKFEEEFTEEFDKKFPEEFKKEFDKEFPDEFKKEFDKSFKKEFTPQFDEAFQAQILQTLTAQGLPREAAGSMVSSAVEQAKADGSYYKAYKKAYKKACDEAYDEAYQKAYDEAYDEAFPEARKEAWDEAYDEAYQEAWDEIVREIDEKYADAEETYELNSSDPAVPVTVHENFYRNETEGAEGTVRIYKKTEDINLACVMKGRLPETADEIAVDRMHAANAGISIGDMLTAGGQEFHVVGFLAYVNYSTLHEKNSDLMFDALKFDVAMVTEEGFDRLHSSIVYSYAWLYQNEPADETEEKSLSDSFLKVLLTQSVAADREIKDYIPRYGNSAVNFATEDMGSDMAMGGVLLYILIGIIAFIFAITSANTITKEASAIGTLRASGYTKGELTLHYLSMPVIVTLFSAVIGNILGYSLFPKVVTAMYYNSYSLPAYRNVWNGTAFFKTTVIPVILMFVINLAVTWRMMQFSPLKFLRHDLKKRRQKKAMRLPKWRFFSRFRLRIIFQNLPNYLVLFLGIFFVAVLLAMAVGMPSTLKYYHAHASEMMFADYQYVLSDYEDEDGEVITTETEGAEAFDLRTLLRKSDVINEEISVYGIKENSRYVELPGYEKLKENEVFISESFSEKYGLRKGDVLTLDEKYENRQYTFTVAGTFEKSSSIAVFLPMKHFEQLFETRKNEFTGYLSNEEISDIDEDFIATVITKREITKMADQLDHSMGSYMTYFQYICILLSAVLIYLLTKIIIEKNESAISMVKILGYEDGEIFRLYLLSTTIMVILMGTVSAILGGTFMTWAWKAIMASYSGYFAFVMNPLDYLKIFAFIFAGYLIVLVLDTRRIRKISLNEALKNAE